MVRKLFASRLIEYSMRSRWKQRGLLLVVGLPALGLAMAGIRMGIAQRLGATEKIADLREAVRLNPANPDLHFRLGTLETYSLGDSAPADGVQQFERATELSPREARYQEALASACELEGNEACATRAMGRALLLSPMTPRIHWEAANYYLRTNRNALALSQFKRLLEIDPGYGAATFQICSTVMDGPETIEREVLTPASSPKLKLAYINFLTTQGDYDFAYRVWQSLAASRAPFNFSSADPYLEHLIARGQVQMAVAVWRDLGRLGVVKRPADEEYGNMVFNGSFEQAPLNAGFGWRYHQEPYIETDFAAPVAFTGRRSLRVDFTVSKNKEYEPVNQIVPVEAGRSYSLTAQVRTEGITSDSGPRLRVVDPVCPACLNVTSVATTGTTPWHKITLNFLTGDKTRLVRLSVERPRSRTFPMGITGSFWLDDVSLKPAVRPAHERTLKADR